MDRERIQQWVVASSRARPVNVSAAKPSNGTSVQQPGAAKHHQRKPETSSVIPRELLMQGQLAWDIGFNKFISQAESALDVARDTCAALILLEKGTKTSSPTSSTCSPFQPKTAMLFSQYEKSRRAKRHHMVTADDASGLSTASALSDVHSVNNSSRITASSRGFPASSASRHG
jgi:hypothetical protein